MKSLLKRILSTTTFIILAVSLIACQIAKEEAHTQASSKGSVVPTAASADAHYQKLSASDAQVRMDSGDPIIILDVRTSAEFAEGHIKGAINLPLDQVEKDAATALPDKEAEILLYCRSGNRSRTASELLLKLGYKKIFDFGGIKDWPGEIVAD